MEKQMKYMALSYQCYFSRHVLALKFFLRVYRYLYMWKFFSFNVYGKTKKIKFPREESIQYDWELYIAEALIKT